MRIFVLRKKFKHIFKEYLVYILVAVLIGLFMRIFIIEVYKVPSESMLPTLLAGDHIAVLKFPFTPKRGDLVVFKKTGENSSFVKRIMGIPSDFIEIKKDRIYINSLPLKLEPFTADTSLYSNIDSGNAINKEYLGDKYHLIIKGTKEAEEKESFSRKIKNGFFLLGDNRVNSVDSRKWGEIEKKDISGRVVFIWFSSEPHTKKIRWNRIGLLK